MRAVRDFLATTTLEGYAFEQLMAAARQSVCAAAGQKMRVFGSAGKADGFRLPAAALRITAENAEDAEKTMNSAISASSAVKLSSPVAMSPA